MKTHSLDEVQDELIGKVGTPNRERFELRITIIHDRESDKADPTGTTHDSGRVGQADWRSESSNITA